jgi:hypothetical protein
VAVKDERFNAVMVLFRASSVWFRFAAAALAAQSVPMPEMEMGAAHGPVSAQGMLRTRQVHAQQCTGLLNATAYGHALANLWCAHALTSNAT